MTGQKKYDHFKKPTYLSEPVISGIGKESQKYLIAKTNKWVRLSRIEGESDDNFEKRIFVDNQQMKKFRSHLLMSKSFDTLASRLTCVVSIEPHIGYGWMPVTGDYLLPLNIAKALAIWYNSTIGRVLLRTVGGRKLAYPMYNPDSWHQLPIPNMENELAIKALEDCFDVTSNMTVPSFRFGRCEVRELWDDAVSSSLNIDRDSIAELADGLACEPSVSKESFYDSV